MVYYKIVNIFTVSLDPQVNMGIDDVIALADIAKSEPQLAYAAIYGMSKRWAFLCSNP